MVVSEIGLNPDWSSAYTANAGQQDAVIRIQLTEARTKTAQEYAIQLRHAIHADSRFVDLDVAFDTGGMVSAALNYGASSPIDIQIDGGTPDQRPGRPSGSGTGWPRSAGRPTCGSFSGTSPVPGPQREPRRRRPGSACRPATWPCRWSRP